MGALNECGMFNLLSRWCSSMTQFLRAPSIAYVLLSFLSESALVSLSILKSALQLSGRIKSALIRLNECLQSHLIWESLCIHSMSFTTHIHYFNHRLSKHRCDADINMVYDSRYHGPGRGKTPLDYTPQPSLPS